MCSQLSAISAMLTSSAGKVPTSIAEATTTASGSRRTKAMRRLPSITGEPLSPAAGDVTASPNHRRASASAAEPGGWRQIISE